MHEYAKHLINGRIEKILEEYDYEKRKINNKNECPCYSEDNGKCHNINDLNCFFCYCPEYDLSREEGGCKINNKHGKWHYSELLKNGKIWDCSNCVYPHEKSTVRSYLKKMFGIS